MAFLKSLILLAGLAVAQQPNSQALIGADYRDFSGGYVDYVSPSNLQPNQSPSLLNVKIDDPPGSLKPREGYTACGITPSGLKTTQLYEYNSNSSGGVPRFIITDSSTAWQTQDCVSFTTVTTRLAGGPLPFLTTVRDKVWIVNRSTYPITWDGTNEVLLDGRANTPNPAPPRFNYIEFWNERVWGARTTTNPSGVFFSDLTDTLGNDLDPSTGTLSWPADNVIQIAQENGSPIYGIKVYRNALFVFKENGIWRIDFNGPFDIQVSKTLSSAGTRYQSSIVEHDNLLYFLGTDGIYAFDGDKAVRISDSFKNKFNDINQTSVSDGQKTWDTKADWTASGTSFSSTTANAVDGSVTISSITGSIANFDNNALVDLSSNPWTCSPASGFTVSDACGPFAYGSGLGAYTARCLGNTGVDSGTLYIIKKVDGSTIAYTGDATNQSLNESNISTRTINTSSYAGTVGYLHLTGGGSSLYSSTFTLGSFVSFQYWISGNGINGFDNIQSTLYFSSGVWTSEVYNLVAVSSFSTLEATALTNGGSIAYSVRVGTSSNAGGILLKPFLPITPGSLITGTSSDLYVQVKATFTAVSTLDASPELQDLTVNTVRGTGSSQSVYGFSFLGNLYISVSTGNASTNNLVLMKSRLPLSSWTLYSWALGPMAKFNSRFYAGDSVTSNIYRMNYGTNDNGSAINWYWESREETYERPNIRKYLQEITIDFRKGTETALTAGYSRDAGLTYTSRSLSAAGSGRGTGRLFLSGSNSTDYRFRVSGSTLDGTVTILGLTGWARPGTMRE